MDLDKGELGPLSQPIPTLEPASARKLMAQLKKFADIKQKNRDFVKRLDDAFDLSHKIDLEMKAKRAKERATWSTSVGPFKRFRTLNRCMNIYLAEMGLNFAKFVDALSDDDDDNDYDMQHSTKKRRQA